MAGFILEERKLIFGDDVTIVEDFGEGRVLCYDQSNKFFTIKKENVLNKDFSHFFN